MNIHTRKLGAEISESEVNEALAVLQKWRDQGGELDLSDEKLIPPQIANLWMHYPELTDKYSSDFKLDGEYKASLPDLQNGPSSLIKGANQIIQHVGISNFKLPEGARPTITGRDFVIANIQAPSGLKSMEEERSEETSYDPDTEAKEETDTDKT